MFRKYASEKVFARLAYRLGAKSCKGFFIMTDVVFAMLLSVLAVVTVYHALDVGQTDVWREDAHHKMAEDVLLVLDKNGTISKVAGMSESAGETELTNALTTLLPTRMAANVTLTIYEDDDDDGEFTPRATNPVYSVKVPSNWIPKRTAYAKRVYAKFDDSNADNNEFGVAEIRLWTVVG